MAGRHLRRWTGASMRSSTQAAWAYIGVGVALATWALFAPERGSILGAAGLAMLAVAIVVAARGQLAPRTALVLSTSVSACFVGSWAINDLGGTSDGVLLASHLLEAIGGIVAIACFVHVLRRRNGTSQGAVLGDAIIVGLGTWLIAWVAFVEPILDSQSEPVVTTLIGGSVHPIGSVMLFLAAVFVISDTTRAVAALLIGTATVAVVTSHIVTALVAAGHIGDGASDVTTPLFIVACALLGAAVLHDSIRSIDQARTAGHEERLLAQLIITTSSLVFPVIVLAASGPNGTGDRIVRSFSALVLAGAVTGRIVVSVRANSEAQAELLRRAQTDPLTGLPNRALLLDQISSYIHESWRPDRVPTLYFVDLDRFKNINDSLGHSAGDDVLRVVADRLVSVAPHGAVVARLSGDEYVVLDPTTSSLAAASGLAERLLAVFREPIPLSQGDVFVTASVGVSSIDSMTAKPEDVLRHADTAMYRAKDAGRNCMAFYDESMHERIAHRLAVETALYRALDRQELRMFHQPILDLETGDVVGFEALMRWQQGDGTMVSPAEFIPIAEETGTIVPIGAWALLEALTQLRRWIDDSVCSATATMSVNVSPRQLADPNLPSIVSEALARSGIDASQLWVEITESVMISEPELALASLQKLNALGVRLALDDFGTGYSSLSLLQRFPLQRIKIDRAFVQGVADNPSDRALVRTIVAMGQSLGLDMVAEGVETLHQMQVLSDLGCKKAQGYLISHPVPADAMRSTVSALERLGRFPLLRGEHRAGQL